MKFGILKILIMRNSTLNCFFFCLMLITYFLFYFTYKLPLIFVAEGKKRVYNFNMHCNFVTRMVIWRVSEKIKGKKFIERQVICYIIYHFTNSYHQITQNYIKLKFFKKFTSFLDNGSIQKIGTCITK